MSSYGYYIIEKRLPTYNDGVDYEQYCLFKFIEKFYCENILISNRLLDTQLTSSELGVMRKIALSHFNFTRVKDFYETWRNNSEEILTEEYMEKHDGRLPVIATSLRITHICRTQEEAIQIINKMKEEEVRKYGMGQKSDPISVGIGVVNNLIAFPTAYGIENFTHKDSSTFDEVSWMESDAFSSDFSKGTFEFDRYIQRKMHESKTQAENIEKKQKAHNENMANLRKELGEKTFEEKLEEGIKFDVDLVANRILSNLQLLYEGSDAKLSREQAISRTIVALCDLGIDLKEFVEL